MACTVCRKRKLRCDGAQPTCIPCVRSSEVCKYDDVSPKNGTKRKVRSFEEYLVAYDHQSNGPIQNPDSADILASVDVFAQYNRPRHASDSNKDTTPEESNSPGTPLSYSFADAFLRTDDEQFEPSPLLKAPRSFEVDRCTEGGPGLSETTKAELTELFFQDVYPNIPIIHKSRYYASLHLRPDLQPPLCLRYAMWALAAIQQTKYTHLANSCYEKARTYLEQDEVRADGTEVLNVAHVQCWSLIATYESYMLLSLRTWSSIRRAAALAQVLRLHNIDECDELTTSPLLPEAQDYSEVEERRRAFWSAFSNDRWVSSRTGYPMTIVEAQITTKLPASEDSFNLGTSEQTQSLGDALEGGLGSKISLFGARAILACILGRVMQHVGSSSSPTKTGNSQQFWFQHRNLDKILRQASLSRPAELRPSSSPLDLRLWALDMWLYGLNICLHQVAVDCATREEKQDQIVESRQQCRDAADHIVRATRSVANLEARKMDPFTASCVYMAGLVLIQDRGRGQGRHTDIDDLRFLQRALEIMHKHWKVTEIFIMQFREDLTKNGISLLLTPSEEQPTTSRKRSGYFIPVQGRPSSRSTSQKGVSL